MDDYVGYKKPPKRTRFRKGVSGNPKGRPKGKRNLATVLMETLAEQVVIREGGVRKRVTKLEATLKQLVNKAASGDLVAGRLLIALVRSAEERVVESAVNELNEDDVNIMKRILERLSRCKKGAANGDV